MIPNTQHNIPEDYLDPITLDIMTDPVIAADGQTYQRESIIEWISRGNRRSPLNGSNLANSIITDNLFAKKLINEFQRRNPEDLRMSCIRSDLNKCIRQKEELIKNLINKIEEITNETEITNDVISNLKEDNLKMKKQMVQLEERNIVLEQEIKEIKNSQSYNLLPKYSKINSQKNSVDFSKLENSQTLLGHSDNVLSLVKIRDDLFASASADRTVKIWRIFNNHVKLFQTLSGHFNSVNSLLKISDDVICSGSMDNNIKIWKEDSGEFTLIQTLFAHSAPVFCLIKIREDLFASGSNLNINIWKEAMGKLTLIQSLKGHSNSVNSLLKISHNLIASASSDTSINIWKEENCEFKLIQILSGHSNSVLCLLLFSDEIFMSGSADSNINIWKDVNGKFILVQTLIGHSDSVLCLLKISNNFIASGSFDKSINLWKEVKGEFIQYKTLLGNSGSVSSLVKISDNMFASGSLDHTIKIWKVRNRNNMIYILYFVIGTISFLYSKYWYNRSSKLYDIK